MRILVSLIALTLLSACAREPDDGDASFELSVEASSAEVIAGLHEFDGGTMPRLLGLRPLGVSGGGAGKVQVLISGESGEKGKIFFAVETVSANESLVTVNIDLPGTVTRSDGKETTIYGADAADMLGGEIEDWAGALARDDVTRYDVAGVNKVLTRMALALAPDRYEYLRGVVDGGDVFAYVETQADFHGGDVPGLGTNREDEPEGFAGESSRRDGWGERGPSKADGWGS